MADIKDSDWEEGTFYWKGFFLGGHNMKIREINAEKTRLSEISQIREATRDHLAHQGSIRLSGSQDIRNQLEYQGDRISGISYRQLGIT